MKGINKIIFPLVFVIICLVIGTPSTQAESLVESSMFYRIYLAFSVNADAVQQQIPDPWKLLPMGKGPFKGANLIILLNDKFLVQDGNGELIKDGCFCTSAFVVLCKNQQTENIAFFVTKTFTPYDDLDPYKNGVKARMTRKATIENNIEGTSSGTETWKIQNDSGPIMEFQMDYQRAVPKRQKSELNVHSNVEPEFYRIYRDKYVSELIKSKTLDVDRIKNYRFKASGSELQKMFDGTEELIGISINRAQVRQVFLP